MNLLYILDNNFVPQVSASICSVCENNKEAEQICFYVISLHILRENEEKLCEFVGTYSDAAHTRKIEFVEIDSVEALFDFDIVTEGWSPIVLVRLLTDKLLPAEVGNVLYLDGDTIVRGDLRKLCYTDMGSCSIGAAIEPTCSRKRKEGLGLAGKPYYNVGVMLMNLDNWRKNKTGDEILSFYRENNGYLFANDQDAINGTQKDKIYTLSCTYNYHNTYDIYTYGIFKNCDYATIPSKTEMKQIRKNPCIIHFLGEDRPWRVGSTHRFKDEYLNYLDKTPYKGQNIEQGWKRYFFCWRIFNIVMKPFPLFRCYLINSLIPFFLKKRARSKR